MVFGIDEDWRLNMLRVVRPDPAGGAPKVMWNLTSDKGSQPMRGFVYGQEVPGMRLVGGAPPQPLEAGVTYHLEVRAGRARGATDFTPRSAESAQN